MYSVSGTKEMNERTNGLEERDPLLEPLGGDVNAVRIEWTISLSVCAHDAMFLFFIRIDRRRQYLCVEIRSSFVCFLLLTNPCKSLTSQSFRVRSRFKSSWLNQRKARRRAYPRDSSRSKVASNDRQTDTSYRCGCRHQCASLSLTNVTKIWFDLCHVVQPAKNLRDIQSSLDVSFLWQHQWQNLCWRNEAKANWPIASNLD